MDILSIKMDIAKRCSDAVNRLYSLNLDYKDILNLVQDGGVPGVDIECRIAFRISKDVGKRPQDIAGQIAELLNDGKYYTVSSSNGYLNFTLSDKFYTEFVLSALERPERKGRCVIVEYPSVNPNKPLHTGHLRNAIMGDCISNLLEYSGYDVIRMNYIDNLGLQVAQSLWMYIKGIHTPQDKKFDHLIGEEYVRVARYYEEDASVRKEVEEIMRKLEEGDDVTCKKEREMCTSCVNAQSKTLQTYGIYHDVLVWESDIVHARLLEKCLKLLEEKRILIAGAGKYAGCKIVELSQHPDFKGLEDADKVFVRANGVATYTAKDTAFAMWKFGLLDGSIQFKEYGIQGNGKMLYTSYSGNCKGSGNGKMLYTSYSGSCKGSGNGKMLYTTCSDSGKGGKYGKADMVVNIIGVEQEYPQKVIRTILEMAGYNEQALNYIHISYGHVRLKEGRFSGRKGTWIGYSADELADESVSKA
ncbi:MAG: arginine--tRNA ligase, partial [Candidatus Micrarchaeia archaeon]